MEMSRQSKSSNDDVSMTSNVGYEVGSPISLKPLSASGSPINTGTEINNTKDLQLSQDQGTLTTPAGESVARPSINALKRGAECSVHKVNQPKNRDECATRLAKLEINQSVPANGIDVGPPYMDTNAESESEILLQSETRPISHDQLILKIKGIYADLKMVEVKCIDVIKKQFLKVQKKDPSRQTKLINEQWQALITLHKILLHEHHDFFLTFQHLFARFALRRLAAKYSMSTKMWRYEIHVFLKIFRHKLSKFLNHLLIFIYIAYLMMILFYEIVSIFEHI